MTKPGDIPLPVGPTIRWSGEAWPGKVVRFGEMKGPGRACGSGLGRRGTTQTSTEEGEQLGKGREPWAEGAMCAKALWWRVQGTTRSEWLEAEGGTDGAGKGKGERTR